MNVEIVHFPETPVACLAHLGSPQGLMASVAKFIEWRRGSSCSPVARTETYGVPHGDPDSTLPANFRFDICSSLVAPVGPNAHGVVSSVLPGGRCAKLRHVGSTDSAIFSPVVRGLYSDWLPGSGQTLRDFPCFFHWVERMPAVSELEQITDIYLPIE